MGETAEVRVVEHLEHLSGLFRHLPIGLDEFIEWQACIAETQEKILTVVRELSAPKLGGAGDGLITVSLPRKKLIEITSNDGGYLGGQCIVCGASGWTETLKHKPGCPLYE